ncbi:MAG: AAA family ATPase [Acholeplasmatales bacterium]|nr:AAA family ATPase [Acholeplasmatales bacterium]
MAILNIKLDNVLSFFDFNVNFSFPNKLKTSIIENENLEYVPSFRYKKLNIFVGSNASGKTSLMKCIWRILLFLNRKEKMVLDEIVNKNDKESRIEIDLVEDTKEEHKLHRYKIIVTDKSTNFTVMVSHTFVNLSSNKSTKDSYENKLKELDSLQDVYMDYIECLNDNNPHSGWNVVLPGTEYLFDRIHFAKPRNNEEQKEYISILNDIFKTLDPSIINVKKSKDSNDAYVLEHDCGAKIIIQEDNLLSAIPLLSSGTKYGVNIANVIFAIKHHNNGIYIIDEQFSYVNSDIEAAMISTMTSLLGPNEQIFFTTHNMNILDLGFPFHSFYFMKKETIDKKKRITINCGSEVENRNNVSPKTIIDNDIFNTAPDVNKIFNISEEE